MMMLILTVSCIDHGFYLATRDSNVRKEWVLQEYSRQRPIQSISVVQIEKIDSNIDSRTARTKVTVYVTIEWRVKGLVMWKWRLKQERFDAKQWAGGCIVESFSEANGRCPLFFLCLEVASRKRWSSLVELEETSRRVHSRWEERPMTKSRANESPARERNRIYQTAQCDTARKIFRKILSMRIFGEIWRSRLIRKTRIRSKSKFCKRFGFERSLKAFRFENPIPLEIYLHFWANKSNIAYTRGSGERRIKSWCIYNGGEKVSGEKLGATE